MLGAIIGAVSPAVVVPMMIYFMEQGKGARKGIPTFVLAGSALDNVFAIVIFTQFLSLYQGVKSSILWDLASIPVAVVLGTLLGLVAATSSTCFSAATNWPAPGAPSWCWGWPSF